MLSHNQSVKFLAVARRVAARRGIAAKWGNVSPSALPRCAGTDPALVISQTISFDECRIAHALCAAVHRQWLAPCRLPVFTTGSSTTRAASTTCERQATCSMSCTTSRQRACRCPCSARLGSRRRPQVGILFSSGIPFSCTRSPEGVVGRISNTGARQVPPLLFLAQSSMAPYTWLRRNRWWNRPG